MLIEFMSDQDASQVLAIYQEGIRTGHATFQDKKPAWQDWDEAHLESCRLVARSPDAVLGWAALSGVSSRCVYGGIAELGVYVSEKARGQGIGGQLLASLIKESEAVGIWLLQAAIFPENKGSIQAHQKAGFRIVGMREKMGKMTFGPLAGQWRDVVLMERRSQLVGVD